MTPTKFLGLPLVIVYMVVLKVLAGLDIRGVFEHRVLLPLLNTLFASWEDMAGIRGRRRFHILFHHTRGLRGIMEKVGRAVPDMVLMNPGESNRIMSQDET